MINYGFVPSKMDGTEHVFEMNGKMEIPESICYKDYLPSVLDQGNRPICVPCSISAFINWQLNLEDGQNGRDNGVDYEDIYKHRSSEGDEGMSFKDALNYLRHNCVKLNYGCKDIVERYAKIGSETYLKRALVVNGPCIGGLPVYDTNRFDFWTPWEDERLQGYHAVSIVGYNKDGFIIRNSWGEWYGDNGYAVVPYDDFNKFMEIWTIY